ncbi:hypothetical protein AZI87_00795 [Bdellovibrio bacteriovorus]|uniref:Uncharacterized protein n=1 Tax=Bdellovibrio bacteriovorus TaxID=959 RepID=A0A162GD50_BDEBC|nr:hypothetical protein [Bdellovibrio bacteriovorus]KYG67851.1 hypothetical protein AZI87_00795 [Bdellovibrio bacteriovorus]
MKWIIASTLLLSPLFSFAQNKCEAEAVGYAREYMDENYGSNSSPSNIYGSGVVDAKGVISYGIEFVLAGGESIVVVPMMFSDCDLLDIQGY